MLRSSIVDHRPGNSQEIQTLIRIYKDLLYAASQLQETNLPAKQAGYKTWKENKNILKIAFKNLF